MIADVDQSLARFLGAALGRRTAISFEAPTEQWAAKWAEATKRPTVSCFLHRVVEDMGRRAADWVDERGEDGRVGGRQPPVRHYQLHYQVSAWATSIDDEHRLLGEVMAACLVGEVLPPEHLVGALEGETTPVLVRLAVPMVDPGPQPHEVWSSLGVPLRASLDLTLVAPLRPALVTDLAPPAEELSMQMESIAPRPADDVLAERLAERRWTAFRIKEKSSSDDAGLDGVGDGV
ncbi:MAG: DUF4255 domain-containing protein [Ilumatobacteraceae bacterium]